MRVLRCVVQVVEWDPRNEAQRSFVVGGALLLARVVGLLGPSDTAGAEAERKARAQAPLLCGQRLHRTISPTDTVLARAAAGRCVGKGQDR